MPGFFDQPTTQYVPNPEPPETTLLRDQLARKVFDLQADPYGGNQMRNNSLNPAPAFTGSGGTPDNYFFYGSEGEPGKGGDNPPADASNSGRNLRGMIEQVMQHSGTGKVAPRLNGPPLRAMQSPQAETPQIGTSGALGRLFDILNSLRSNSDSRGGLRALLQRKQALTNPAPLAGAASYDGGPDLLANARMRGLYTGNLNAFNDLLSRWGARAAFGPDRGLTITGPGGSYTNQGASHEGAGPGGQSEFLMRLLGIQPDARGQRYWGGDVANLDTASAAVRTLGDRARQFGLDPNQATYEDVAKANLASRTPAGIQNPANWAGHARMANPNKMVPGTTPGAPVGAPLPAQIRPKPQEVDPRQRQATPPVTVDTNPQTMGNR